MAQESQNVCVDYLVKFSIEQDEIWFAFGTCWSDEIPILCYLLLIKVNNPTLVILLLKISCWLVFRRCGSISFKHGVNTVTTRQCSVMPVQKFQGCKGAIKSELVYYWTEKTPGNPSNHIVQMDPLSIRSSCVLFRFSVFVSFVFYLFS